MRTPVARQFRLDEGQVSKMNKVGRIVRNTQVGVSSRVFSTKTPKTSLSVTSVSLKSSDAGMAARE